MEPQRGELVATGKTKRIYAVVGEPDQVIVENKTAITAHDDPQFTRSFAAKAKYATTTTCRIFELLAACGVPVAYLRQLSETEFLASRSAMLLLEIVGRRLAFGSFLKRHPNLASADQTKSHRFHRLWVEFFLKTTGKKWGEISLPTDDPLIVDPTAKTWQLAHPKKPRWEEGSLFTQIPAPDLLPSMEPAASILELDKLLRRAFLVLEKTWAMLGITLVDIKVEGDAKGRISDVVDNDSWRIWKDGKPLDKQVFRDGGEAVLDEVEANYGQVAQLAGQLKVPRQALILWRGSESDQLPTVEKIPGVEVVPVTLSGHKQPTACLDRLERILQAYPEGVVIVAIVGRSNGLGPLLAARTCAPVIAVSATLKEFEDDVWSSLRLPSNVPLTTVWPESNAVEAALNMLAITNPAVYAYRQLAIEGRDGNSVLI